ncbi:MAG: hypothetical protein AAF004_04735 [Pseudomonadota bacterium]
MTLDRLSDSAITKIAGSSPHLDALADMASGMDLSERSNLVSLERNLHNAWALGANSIISWAHHDQGICLLVVPHYALAEYTAMPAGGDMPWRPSESFITELISGEAKLSISQLQKVARLLDVEPTLVNLRDPLTKSAKETLLIEAMVKRYGVNHVKNRAVALFDIVGFSLLTPFEQMTQLNSLSYSLNAAHSKLLDRKIGISFARSSSGDGFYIWNRDRGELPNINLYHFMQLVLADNAIARSKAVARSVPLLRTAFHIGSCYEFHQADGLNPTTHDYIVGDVTIELARMIERAMPGQIFVGAFDANDDDKDDINARDAISFVEYTQRNMQRLHGLDLSGERVTSIKCYLTGERCDGGRFSIRKLIVDDKHGRTRFVYNAKVNIHRHNAEPILLGIEDKTLRAADLAAQTAELVFVPQHQYL